MAVNPPVNSMTLTFASKTEAVEHFDFLGFKALPVSGPADRRVARTYDDDGNRLIVFASSAGLNETTGEVHYHVVEYSDL